MLSPVNRPTLIPGLPRVWRGPTELQLGTDPARAVVLRLPDPATAMVLDLLDGSRPERSVLLEAASAGVVPEDARALLTMLQKAHLVLPAAELLPGGSVRGRLLGEAAALALGHFAAHLPALRLAERAGSGSGVDSGFPVADSSSCEARTEPRLPTGRSDNAAMAGAGGTGRSTGRARARRSAGAAAAEHGDERHDASRAPTGSARGPAPAQPPTGLDTSDSVGGHGRGGAESGGAGQVTASRRQWTPAAVLRRRQAARVLISGRGRLGAGIAVALAEAGVGQIHADQPGTVQPGELAGGPLRGTDVGRARCEAVSEAVLRAAPGVQAHGVRKTPATLVLQLDHDEPAALLAEAHARRRQPHLAVTIREAAVVVGPLVPAVGGPCLACLELHRRERDAAWPGPGRTDGPEPCAVTTLLAATAYAAAEALTFLDGATPETLGASVEISAPGRVRRRTWPPHPDCDCTRRRRRRAPGG